ncbi:hypothetical protein TKK_0014520 [Trichogramma kaykai]
MPTSSVTSSSPEAVTKNLVSRSVVIGSRSSKCSPGLISTHSEPLQLRRVPGLSSSRPHDISVWRMSIIQCRNSPENEELLKMFDKLKHLKTREEQFDSPELAEHAQKVMNTLDEGIQGLDDLDVFLDFLHQIGASHSKIPGFQSDFFWTRLAGDSVTGPTTHSGMPWSLACCRVHLEAREGRKWTRKHNDASTSHHSTDCSSGTSKTSADASLPA